MGAELAPETAEDQSVGISVGTESPRERSQPAFQPAPKIGLTDAQMREATMNAAMSGTDPFTLTVGDVTQGSAPKAPAGAQAEQPVEIPEKFKKPNGEVDVEKLNTSSRQLDEAIKDKEAKLLEVNKFVEDGLREYKEKYSKFRSMPNPAKVAAQAAPPPPDPQMETNRLREMIARDFNADPIGTLAQLTEIVVHNKLEPFEEERRENQLRENLVKLVKDDPRVLECMPLINAKLEADPGIRSLKNPHKAAWLEVREDMRLGGPARVQAQPSKPATPILAGGTPPPAPSSSGNGVWDQGTILDAAKELGKDPRDANRYDPAKHAALDNAAKQFFDALDRKARR